MMTLFQVILNELTKAWAVLSHWGIWLVSLIVGTLGTALGYPKQVLIVILIAIILDTLTKWYSIVTVNYKQFTLPNFFKAWKDKNLTSRALKNGVGSKTIMYLPVLYLAHQASILPQIIGGVTMSNVLYTIILLIEGISIIENFIDCGYTGLTPILNFFKKKQEEVTGTPLITPAQNNQGDEEDVDSEATI